MKCESKYDIFQEVYIIGVESKGIVDGIVFTGNDIQYDVRIWTKGELKTYRLWEFEINSTKKRSEE